MLNKYNLYICFFLINALIFIYTYQVYPGSYLIYFLFSAVFFISISINWLPNFSYSYFFLSILLWLGFYIKLVSHLLHSFPYLDPIGRFVSTPSSWDEVLLLSSTSALGLIVGRCILAYSIKKLLSRLQVACNVPIGYIKNRRILLVLIVLLILLIGITNSYFGIHQIGMAPRTIFIYPANAFIAYMLNFGLISVISIYLWWDVHSGSKVTFVLAIVLLEGLCVSMSIVSRGIFIYHLLPILLVIWRMRLLNLNLKTIATLFLVASLFFATSYFVVDAVRGYLYRAQDIDFRVESKKRIDELNLKLQEMDAIEKLAPTSADNYTVARRNKLNQEILSLKLEIDKNQSEIASSSGTLGGRVKLIASELADQVPAALSRATMLLTNRWVGLEGAMSIQAIPNKSFDLFFRGLNESYQPNVVPLYQHLSKSIYTGMDPNQWKFGSLPGATAFLFYSGSFIFVFLGMFMLTAMATCFEYLILFLTGNLFLVSLYSFFIANIIAQLGDVPKQNLITIAMLLFSAAIIKVLQKYFRHQHILL